MTKAAKKFKKNIFINCPFDPDYISIEATFIYHLISKL